MRSLFRNSVDDSITIADKERDYMQFLDNILVIGGKDKPVRSEMRVAQSELFLKHKGAKAALYGDLGTSSRLLQQGNASQSLP